MCPSVTPWRVAELPAARLAIHWFETCSCDKNGSRGALERYAALRRGTENETVLAVLSARVVLAAALSAPARRLIANGTEEWIGSSRQWSIGYVNNGGEPYRALVWDSMTGRDVEFRESLKDASWIIKNDAWTLPDKLST